MFNSSNTILLAGLGSIGGLAIVVMLMGKMRSAMLVMAAMLTFSSMAVAHNFFGRPQILWLNPIQMQRSNLYMAFGGTLFVTMLVHLRFMSIRRISGPGIVLLFIAFYAALLQAHHEGPAAAAKSVVFAVATIVPMLFVIPAVLQERKDWFWFMRAIMLAHAIWVFFVLIQIGINHNPMILGNGFRFVGLTANPQHASVLLACMAVVALWLSLNDLKRLRLLWAGMLGVTVILLAWTGSRTGMGMLVIGATAILYARVGRTILILPAIALAGAVGFKVLQSLNVDLGLERLTSTANTRDVAWATLLRSGLSSPLVGVGLKDAGDTENSYLLAFAGYGLGMVALVCTLMFACIIQSLRIFKRRWSLPPADRTLADLIIGVEIMYFAGAVFEGYVMARVGPPLMFLLIFSGMGSALISVIDGKSEQSWDESGWEWDADEYEYDDYAHAV